MRSLKGREVVRAFERAGFMVVRTSGSHRIMKHPEKPGTVSVPMHAGKDIKAGTLKGLISAAGMTKEEFWQLVE